jgi:CHAD domain-containing protein
MRWPGSLRFSGDRQARDDGRSTAPMSAGGVVRAKVDVAIVYPQRADAAAAAVLRRLLEVAAENLEGAMLGEDPEFLHQLRIAVRRSRTVQRQLKGVFPALELPGLRGDFRWLQRATGEARDLDVHAEEFTQLAELVPAGLRPALEPLRVTVEIRRVGARERLAATLRSARLQELIADWERLLESLVELPLDDRPSARRSIGGVVGERSLKVYEEVIAIGEAIGPEDPAAAYHALRKKGKELRYLLELFGARLFDPEVVDPLLRSLKDLQELLGRHQDREVQVAMIQTLAPDVAQMPGGPAACLAMGVLVERLADDERAARREFAERFVRFADDEQRRRVAEAFAGVTDGTATG